MCKQVIKTLALPILLLTSCTGFAAQLIDLDTQPVSKLKSFIAQQQFYSGKPGAALATTTSQNQDDLKEVNRDVDFNGTTHIRVQQTHDGYPVWGGDAVVHVRKPQLSKRSLASLAAAPEAASSDMSGQVYQNLNDDLQNTPASVFTREQADKAQVSAIKLANQKYVKTQPAEKNTKLMIYVDADNKAHWAYLTTLYFPASAVNNIPANPNFIMDAVTLQVYKEWNDVQAEFDGLVSAKKPRREKNNSVMAEVDGGGLGGNETNGRIIYDGLQNDAGVLAIERDAARQRCYLANVLAEVRDNSDSRQQVVSFPCKAVNDKHNHVYWDNNLEAVNGGYSPANDALYAGSLIKSLYKDWYNFDMLVDKHGKPMRLKLMVHTPSDTGDGLENAFWNQREQVIYLGDGAQNFYPLTSLGVVAHEVSHGFTQQHSGLIYESQSGGLNESFSDMASMAAEYFAYGKNTWQIGSEISKVKGQALRYLDHPARDCEHSRGDCSIEHVKDYDERLNVHYSSGIFNRVFYLMATADGWTPKKAFNVMVQANANYWTATTTFTSAACGVLRATKDHGFDTRVPLAAFKDVGINTGKC